MNANRIIQDVCMEFAVDPDEILGGISKRRGVASGARRALVQRMRDCGFSMRETGKAMGINASSVLHHLTVTA